MTQGRLTKKISGLCLLTHHYLRRSNSRQGFTSIARRPRLFLWPFASPPAQRHKVLSIGQLLTSYPPPHLSFRYPRCINWHEVHGSAWHSRRMFARHALWPLTGRRLRQGASCTARADNYPDSTHSKPPTRLRPTPPPKHLQHRRRPMREPKQMTRRHRHENLQNLAPTASMVAMLVASWAAARL